MGKIVSSSAFTALWLKTSLSLQREEVVSYRWKASRAMTTLIQSLWGAHACLDGQATHVLPALLQQTDQIVDSQHDVRDQFVLGHSHVTDRDTETQHFLELKFNGGFDFGDLLAEVFVVGDGGGKFAG